MHQETYTESTISSGSLYGLKPEEGAGLLASAVSEGT